MLIHCRCGAHVLCKYHFHFILQIINYIIFMNLTLFAYSIGLLNTQFSQLAWTNYQTLLAQLWRNRRHITATQFDSKHQCRKEHKHNHKYSCKAPITKLQEFSRSISHLQKGVIYVWNTHTHTYLTMDPSKSPQILTRSPNPLNTYKFREQNQEPRNNRRESNWPKSMGQTLLPKKTNQAHMQISQILFTIILTKNAPWERIMHSHHAHSTIFWTWLI